MVYVPAVKLIAPDSTPFPKAEDAAALSGDFGLPILGQRSDVPTSRASTDGDYVIYQLDAKGRLYVAGQIAHDSPIDGSPYRIGGRARTSEMVAVANDDAVDLVADEYGKQIVLPYSHPSKYTDGVTAAITGTSDTAVIAAPGASLYLNITWALVTNSHATVGTLVELKSGSTVRARGYAVALGGGFMVVFRTPLRLAVNTAFNAGNITTGSNTYVSAGGYVSAN